ncbi:unnamed protein product [Boreogadus saida]
MVQRNSCILLCYWRPLLGTLLSYNMNPAVLVVPQRPSAALSTRTLSCVAALGRFGESLPCQPLYIPKCDLCCGRPAHSIITTRGGTTRTGRTLVCLLCC